MMDTVIFSSPVIIALVCLVSALHIASAIPTAVGVSERARKTLSTIFAVLGILSHIALFAAALILKTGAEEIFLAVMISAAVGMLSVYISEKVAEKKSAIAVRKEENDGI